MLSLLVASILIFLFAQIESADDYAQIQRKETIDHAQQWLMRGTMTVLYLLFCGELWWAFGLAGLFSAVFRFQLNKKRGLDWRYVSPSNLYDYVWLFITWFRHLSRPVPMRDAYLFHHSYYWPMGLNDQYQPSVHRAGALAYTAEMVVIIGTFALELFF